MCYLRESEQDVWEERREGKQKERRSAACSAHLKMCSSPPVLWMMMNLAIKPSLFISLVYFQAFYCHSTLHALASERPIKRVRSFRGTVWLPDMTKRLGEKFTVSTMPLFAIFTWRAQVFTSTTRFGLLCLLRVLAFLESKGRRRGIVLQKLDRELPL